MPCFWARQDGKYHLFGTLQESSPFTLSKCGVVTTRPLHKSYCTSNLEKQDLNNEDKQHDDHGLEPTTLALICLLGVQSDLLVG
jgi:hypothetical protein